MSPALSARTVAPRTSSVPLRQTILTKPPASAPSRMPRSLSSRWEVYMSTSKPLALMASGLDIPHEATSGSVYVQRGTTISESLPEGAFTGKSSPSKSAFCTAMPAMVPAMCVNLNSGRSMTSPTARMSGLEVERSSLTLTPRPGLKSTPAASSPRPSTFGARPVATRKASQTIVSASSFPGKPTSTLISGQGLPAVCCTDLTATLVRMRTPSCSSVLCTTDAASGSSGPRMRAKPSKSVTSEPKRRKACAISKPIGPPPKTIKRGGNSVRLNSVAFVRYGASAKPGMGGTFARAPVAITAFRNFSCCSPTFSSCGPVKVALPMYMSAPAFTVVSHESTGAICARSFLIRSMTFANCTAQAVGSRPRSDRRISAAARAQRRSAFEGTQPTFKQSPPAKCCSMRQLLAPRRADCLAETRPPAPAPTATRS
mmetsp:Transcript_115447/g.337647  ORF Transcript_115447/g.337647 Transcript_115447/m.337647 type:complete len:429 (+) Transcript_115447:239-1525(+)